MEKLLQAILDDNIHHWGRHVDAWEAKADREATGEKMGIEVYEAVLQNALANLTLDAPELDSLAAVKARFYIPDEAAAAVDSRYAKRAVKILLKRCLTDGFLTPSEIHSLHHLGTTLGMAKDEVDALIESRAGSADRL